MANPYRSREGLSARPVGPSEEIQVKIDPLHADLDDQITGLHSQVLRLKDVAREIEAETKLQNDLITDLEMTLSRAGSGIKNGMQRLNKTIRQSSNHIVHVIVFGLVFFTLVYFWSKLFRK